MTLPLVHAALLILLNAIAISWCLGKDRPRAVQKLGVALGWVTPFVALVTEGPPLVRGVLAVAGLMFGMRAIDLYRDREPYGLAFRLWFLGAVFDGRQVQRARPRLAWGLFLQGAAYLALFCLCFRVLRQPFAQAGGGALPVRWLLGTVLAYAIVDCVGALVVAIYAALGVRVDPLHLRPILSRTVQEFWGERWNRPVHVLLTRHCFTPLARQRRPRLGVFMAFVGSAAIHFWMIYAALSTWPALVMGSFFVLHGGVVLLERRLHVARWRSGFARAWTIAWFVLTAPLFVEPGLRMLEL